MVRPLVKQELLLLRQSGKITAAALVRMLKVIRVGISGLELEKVAEEEILKRGGQPAFKTVKGYHWTICITINNQVVHGIPTDYKIKEGDLVSIDVGAVYNGWHTDAAWSVVVGENSESQKFLSVGEQALWDGISQAIAGKRIGDISAAIQNKVEGAGYSVVKSLVGHGIGKNLHEEPEVPGFGKAGIGILLKKGMVLAIEVIYNQGGSEVKVEDDGWTISSADGSLAGLFEMTVVVGEEKTEVLTDWRKA